MPQPRRDTIFDKIVKKLCELARKMQPLQFFVFCALYELQYFLSFACYHKLGRQAAIAVIVVF